MTIHKSPFLREKKSKYVRNYEYILNGDIFREILQPEYTVYVCESSLGVNNDQHSCFFFFFCYALLLVLENM